MPFTALTPTQGGLAIPGIRSQLGSRSGNALAAVAVNLTRGG